MLLGPCSWAHERSQRPGTRDHTDHGPATSTRDTGTHTQTPGPSALSRSCLRQFWCRLQTGCAVASSPFCARCEAAGSLCEATGFTLPARLRAGTSWYQLVPSWYQLVPVGTQLVLAGTQLVPSCYPAGTSWYPAELLPAGTRWYPAGVAPHYRGLVAPHYRGLVTPR